MLLPSSGASFDAENRVHFSARCARRGRKPELTRDCDPLTATTKSPIELRRTRSIEGVTPADRILHGVLVFSVKAINEIGRRRGREIRTWAKESGS